MQSNKFWKKSLKKCWDIQVWIIWRSSRGSPENVLRTCRINLPGTSLERQIRTSPGRHFRASSGRQIGTSPGRSNRIFRRRPRDVGGGLPWDVLGTNICRLGCVFWPNKLFTNVVGSLLKYFVNPFLSTFFSRFLISSMNLFVFPSSANSLSVLSNNASCL